MNLEMLMKSETFNLVTFFPHGSVRGLPYWAERWAIASFLRPQVPAAWGCCGWPLLALLMLTHLSTAQYI